MSQRVLGLLGKSFPRAVGNWRNPQDALYHDEVTAPPENAPIALADTVVGLTRGSGERTAEGRLVEDTGAAAVVFPPRSVEARSAEALVGRRIDHFEIEAVLGMGGMGTVYAARDLSLDRPVALKMLREVFRQPAHEERLMREARAQAKLQSPHVVAIHYIGRTGFAPSGTTDRPPPQAPEEELPRATHVSAAVAPEHESQASSSPPLDATPHSDTHTTGMLYFAMEHVRGGSLEDVLDQGSGLHSETARRLMLQIARGLRAAKRAGILHRDIKPSNLLRGADGTVKIADFGLAKPLESDASLHEGVLVGSPFYMSPEQATGQPLDHRSDLYSLGATFYHLLAKRPPFDGESVMAVVSQHANDPAPPLAERAPHVPSAMADIIDRLLAKEPDARFADHDALIDALKEAAPGRLPLCRVLDPRRGHVPRHRPRRDPHRSVRMDGHAHSSDPRHGGARALGADAGQVSTEDSGMYRRGRTPRLGAPPWGEPSPVCGCPSPSASPSSPATGSKVSARPSSSSASERPGACTAVILSLALGNGLLSLLYGASLAVAGFHPQKRAVHDLITGTLVRYRWPSQ